MIPTHSAVGAMVVIAVVALALGLWLRGALDQEFARREAERAAEPPREPLQIEGAPAVPVELPGTPDPEPEEVAPSAIVMTEETTFRLGAPIESLNGHRLGQVTPKQYDPLDVPDLACVMHHPLIERQPYWEIELPDDPDRVLAVCEAHSRFLTPTPEG